MLTVKFSDLCMVFLFFKFRDLVSKLDLCMDLVMVLGITDLE